MLVLPSTRQRALPAPPQRLWGQRGFQSGWERRKQRRNVPRVPPASSATLPSDPSTRAGPAASSHTAVPSPGHGRVPTLSSQDRSLPSWIRARGGQGWSIPRAGRADPRLAGPPALLQAAGTQVRLTLLPALPSPAHRRDNSWEGKAQPRSPRRSVARRTRARALEVPVLSRPETCEPPRLCWRILAPFRCHLLPPAHPASSTDTLWCFSFA